MDNGTQLEYTVGYIPLRQDFGGTEWLGAKPSSMH
jgi:hypothetical protein